MKILRELRQRATLTLRQVEEATGISNAYLSQLETGKIKRPSTQSLYVLAKLYGTNVEDLLIGAGYIDETSRVIPVLVKKKYLEQRVEEIEKRIADLESQLVVFKTFGK